MDPCENPTNPNAPGPSVSSSQSSFQFSQSPFGISSFGQNTAGSIFGQNVQFGSISSGSAEWKPSNEPVFSNPFASTKIASSIFGGRAADDLTAAVKPQIPAVKFESTEVSQPVASTSTTIVKSRFPPTINTLFGGHPNEQPGGNIQTRVDSNTITENQQMTVTTFSETTENVPAELQVAKVERKKDVSKHPVLNTLAKTRIRNIISENRVGDEDEELSNLQEMKESILRKLADRKHDKKHKSADITSSRYSGNRVEDENEELSNYLEKKESILQKHADRKHEKKRKSTDTNDDSPGKITKEDRALYFTLPNETFTKALLKQHFSTFGEVSRLYLNTTKNHCIVHFVRHEDAIKAYENGSVINGCAVRLFWRNIRSKKKSESSKEGYAEGKRQSKKRSIEVDPEVQEELAAMGGLEKYRPIRVIKKSAEPSMTVRRLARLKESSKAPKKIPHKTELSSKEAESFEKGTDGGTAEVFIEATAGAQELVAIMKTAATSLEDRLRILEARDKLIRLGQVRQCDLANAKKTVGVCPDMCPEKERLLRETRRQVSVYEMDDSTKKMNPALAVKQYARSSADQEEPLPHELRPLPVMAMTMSYLLHCIADLCDRPGENLAEWYHYLWDRTRSIRKEITQQELCDLESVQLVEQCARFHIHCCARLVAEDVSVFDHRINTENLTKCLQTLKHMYYDLWVKHNQTCPNEPEFMSYFLLLNLNNGSVMWELEQLREDVLQTPEINFAAKLYMAINSNNFVRFFRLVRSASYLASCLAIRYFYQVRTLALRTHIKALNARDKPILYPLATLVRELAFEDFAQGEHFCAHHGLSVDHSQTDFPQALFSRNTFRIATTVFAASRSLGLVESKRNCSVGEVIAGGTLPPRSFEKHVPHNSFDSNGFLKQSAWYAVDQGMTPTDLSFEEDFGEVSEMDSSATPSEVGEIIGMRSCPITEEPQPIITEPLDDDDDVKSTPFRTPNPPTPQISGVKRPVQDIITPSLLLQKKSTVSEAPTTSAFSQSSQIKSIFGAAATSIPFTTSTTSTTCSTTTWMSHTNTTQFNTIFGTSTKSSTDTFSTSEAPTTKTKDSKPTPTVQTPFFSKTCVVTSTTNSFSLSGATSAFGNAVTTPSFGAATTRAPISTSTQTTGVASVQGVKTTSSPFGGATASRVGTTKTASAGGTTIFGGATTTIVTSASSSTVSTPAKSSPFAIKNDAARALTAQKPVHKTQEDRKSLEDAKAAAAKKEADAKEAEEKMRARLLESHVTRISQESLDRFVSAELRQIAEESLKIAKETAKKAKEEMGKRALELRETLMTEVVLKELEQLVAEELNRAIEQREKVIRRITAKYFTRWLEKTRLSLSRKKAIENFPAGVIHLSLEEHAKRWGSPSLSRVQDFVKQIGFHVRGIPKPTHSWTSLSSLVGKEVMHRYHDQCRQLRWKHSNEVAFKVFVSVSNDVADRSSRITEWFVRNPQQLKHGSPYEDSTLGVVRYVTTYKVAPDQTVHSSLQLVRGNRALESNPELAAGTSAILFCMNLSENIHNCCDRLEAILESLTALPAPPLVVIVFGTEKAMDAITLKTLVSNLGLFRKLRRGNICDYKVLYLKETSDLLAVDFELKKALSYTAQKWCPPQQFTVKPLRTVLIGAFDMFFISLTCSLDRNKSKFINDPQILAELCNEFLKYTCAVLLRSRRESKLLCAPEMWSVIYKGVYNRFHDHPSYERHIASLLSSLQIPEISGWPPGNPSGFRTWLTRSQSIVSQCIELIDRWSKVSPWPQVLQDIPWIQVFKACMEKKFQESNMSGLCGSELYVIVGLKRLEKLHNDPWWKHSRRLHTYLSKFEKKTEDCVLADLSNLNNVTESDPPLKKRCLDNRLTEPSVPNLEEITQIIEDHHQSLRNNIEDDLMDQEDVRGSKMSKLEMMIDSLQSRLGLGPYTLPKVEPLPKTVETRKPVDPAPRQVLQLDTELVIPKEAELVYPPQEKSREGDKDKMKKIFETARNIVTSLNLSPADSKHRKVIQDFLLGRGKGDMSAAEVPLSVLSRSDFVERSKREVEQRIQLHKRAETPEEESEQEPEAYRDESSNSQSGSVSRDQRRGRRRKLSDRSNISEDSVEAYSVTSDEEKSDYDSDDYEKDSMGYDDYEDSNVAVKVVRSSSNTRGKGKLVEVEESFNESKEELEDEGDSEEDEEEDARRRDTITDDEEDVEAGDERRRELSGSDIKITDDDEEVEDEDVYEEIRDSSTLDDRNTNDDDTGNVSFEINDEDFDKDMEEEEYEGEEEFDGEEDCSDVQEISSDEEVNVKQDVSDEESNGRSNDTENCNISSDEVVSDYE